MVGSKYKINQFVRFNNGSNDGRTMSITNKSYDDQTCSWSYYGYYCGELIIGKEEDLELY